MFVAEITVQTLSDHTEANPSRVFDVLLYFKGERNAAQRFHAVNYIAAVRLADALVYSIREHSTEHAMVYSLDATEE